MYASPNYHTKTGFIHGWMVGDKILLYQPGVGPPPPWDGKVAVEGPHYPAPHTWYADVTLEDGKIVKIT